MCLVALYCCSDVDTVSLEFEAPPEALQASHLRIRPVKEEQKRKRRQRKGKLLPGLLFKCPAHM